MLNRNDYFNIGLHLKFSDFFHFCSSDRALQQLCSSESFWQQYLDLNFGVDQPISGLTFKETGQKVFEILKASAKHQYYFSLKALLTLLKLPEAEIDEKIEEFNDNDIGPHIISIGDVTEKDPIGDYPKLPKVQPSVNYNSSLSFHNKYNKSELAFIRAVDKLIHRPTLYVTLNGLITIPYDIDQLDNISFNENRNPTNDNDLDLFIEHINDLYSVEQRIINIRFFG